MQPLRRIKFALLAVCVVLVAGTVGYVLLGFGLVEALYQTVTTVSTVGFREVRPLGTVGQVFTMALILAGVGTTLYMFSLLLEALIEGHLRRHLEGRRMARDIARTTGHVIICGWGRVGRACAEYLHRAGHPVVVVDRDEARLEEADYDYVVGDVTNDAVLASAGIDRARALIAALDTDAANVYVTLSSRAVREDLVIIARARSESSKDKLLRAGANRAVNPQMIGGRRMATFALQQHVAEFVDGVLHDESLDYRLEQLEITTGSRLAGTRLGDAALADRTGVLLLAVRGSADGSFRHNPEPDTSLQPGSILIVSGTSSQLDALRNYAGG